MNRRDKTQTQRQDLRKTRLTIRDKAQTQTKRQDSDYETRLTRRDKTETDRPSIALEARRSKAQRTRLKT
jgi:hypothetical protein